MGRESARGSAHTGAFAKENAVLGELLVSGAQPEPNQLPESGNESCLSAALKLAWKGSSASLGRYITLAENTRHLNPVEAPNRKSARTAILGLLSILLLAFAPHAFALSNGQAANLVLGQSSFITNNTVATTTELNLPNCPRVRLGRQPLGRGPEQQQGPGVQGSILHARGRQPRDRPVELHRRRQRLRLRRG